MKLTEQEAKQFWLDILRNVDAHCVLAEHGNSGEFFDKREYKSLEIELEDSNSQLFETFGIYTGWTPVLSKGDESTLYMPTWKFIPYEPSN